MAQINNSRFSLVLGVVILSAIGATIWWVQSSRGSRSALRAGAGAKAWYTSDNGKSWFVDDMSRLAPFENEGKLAYRCYLYSCDGGTTKFVAYLERYTPEARQQLEDLVNAKRPPQPGAIEQLMTDGVEISQPNTGHWIKATDPQAYSVRTPICPGGSRSKPIPGLPPN